ncbi:MAG: WD40/YVTN/BNR-like repeat-containing protein [Candidatus Kapaibacterium sp.]
MKALVRCDSSMLLTTVDDVLLSTNGGGRWKELAAPLPHKGVIDVLPVDDSIYVLTSNGALHRTTNGGLTWSPSKRYKPGQTNRLIHESTGVSAYEAQSPNMIDSTLQARFTVRDSTLEVQLYNGMRVSITSTDIREVTCIAATDSIVYIGRARLPVLAIQVASRKVSELGMGQLNQEHVAVLRVHNDYLYAGVMLGQGGVHRRPLTGNYWEVVNVDRNTETVDAQCIVSGKSGLYIGFREHGVAWLPDGGHVAYPIHEGLVGSLIQSSDAYRGGYILTARLRGLIQVKNCGMDIDRFSSNIPYSGEYVAGVSDSLVIVGLYEGVLIRSRDDGKHWDTLALRFTQSAINRIRSFGSTVFICTNEGAWSSSDNGDTWTPAFSQLSRQGIQDVYKAPNGWVIRTYQSSYILDADGTLTVFAPEGDFPHRPHLLDVTTHGNNIYAVGYPGAFASSDGGKTWKIFTITDNSILQTISVIDGQVFFSGIRGDIYYTNIQDLD